MQTLCLVRIAEEWVMHVLDLLRISEEWIMQVLDLLRISEEWIMQVLDSFTIFKKTKSTVSKTERVLMGHEPSLLCIDEIFVSTVSYANKKHIYLKNKENIYLIKIQDAWQNLMHHWYKLNEIIIVETFIILK